ncbi:MAG TPA: helix-turn-helix domain-containing protein [Chloroflexota bacterium]|jgi:hypothetical protein|nr:helix-turn-helix domain-containing protein [Chloroflexota bacterium]
MEGEPAAGGDLAEVRAELAALRERVARLEAEAVGRESRPPEEGNPLAQQVEAAYEAASEEARRYPIGSVRLLAYFRLARPHQNEYARIAEDVTAGFDTLLKLPSEGIARSLAGLAHPVRLELYKALLTGAQDSAALMEAAGLNTSGQLYHHLREMEEVGLVVRRGRNLWANVNLQAFAFALQVGKELMLWRGEGRAAGEGAD